MTRLGARSPAIACAALALAACTDYPAATDPTGNRYTYLKPPFSGPTTTDTAPPGDTSDTTSETSDTTPDVDPGARTTWHKDVRPIVEARCWPCHTADGVAPMPLDSFAATEIWRDTMVDNAESGRMPPVQATSGCHDVVENQRKLSAAEKQAFLDWKDDGFPAGSESDYRAPPSPPAFVPPVGLTVTLGRDAHTIGANEGARCFALDTTVGVADPRGWWVTGIQITPSPAGIARFATLYAVPGDAALPTLAADGGFDCAAAAGLADVRALFAWVPKKAPLTFPDDAALLLEEGTRFVLRLGYNPGKAKAGTVDATSVKLWRLDGIGKPEQQVRVTTVRPGTADDPPFYTFSQRVIGVTPEMAASGNFLSLNKAVGGSLTCLATVSWDPLWMETLTYAAGDGVPIELGDVAQLACLGAGGAPDASCRAHVMSLVPLYDTLRTADIGVCDGVDLCVAGCESTGTCLTDCLAWETADCRACALGPVFTECAPDVSAAAAAALRDCIQYNGCAGDGWAGWLACADACLDELRALDVVLSADLEAGSPACRALYEQCGILYPE